MTPDDGKQRHTPARRASAAALVRERVEAGGERFWSLRDFPGHSPSAVLTALSRLNKEGVLQRVRKGVYYRPTPTRFGTSAPVASAAAAATLRAPVHPAGLTAANVLGFSTQNPFRREFATPAAGRPLALSDATVYTRRPDNREDLSPTEGALLEFLRERGRSSDLSPERTRLRLRQLLSEDDTFARLAKAAEKEPPRVRAMLGALGEELGADSELLEQLRNTLNPSSRFDFGVLADLEHAPKWQAKRAPAHTGHG